MSESPPLIASSSPLKATYLLRLPPELLVQIFQNLDVEDLRRCRKTNRFLYTVITGSLVIRYGAAKQLASVQDTQHSLRSYGLSDRLEYLRRLQRSWLYFICKPVRSLTVGYHVNIHEFASEIYFVGGTPDTPITTSLKYARVSTPECEWEDFEIGNPVLDFTSAILEYNLVAVVTYSPHPVRPAEEASVDIHLLDFSTRGQHALATQPVIHIHDVELHRDKPEVRIQLAGDNLLLAIQYTAFDDEEPLYDALHVYDWKSGLRKMDPIPSDAEATFLSLNTLLIPNRDDNSLDIYDISSTGGADLIHSFSLPPLNPHYFVSNLICSGGPNPLSHAPRPASLPWSSKRYVSTPDDSLMVAFLGICLRDDEDDEQDEQEFIFIFPRSALSWVSEQDETALRSTPWQRWGPRNTRWLDTRPMTSNFLNCINGQRFIWISDDAPGSLHILDFNPSTLAAVQQKEAHELNCPTATIDATTTATKRTEYTVFTYPGFLDTIVSYLPYVETVSTQKFMYDAITLDESHIIGVTFSKLDLEVPESIEVLRFA